MKNLFGKIFSCVIAAAILASMCVPAFAAGSAIVFKGAEEGFEFRPGSAYTATDMFGNFKNVMPGDRLTETVSLSNEADDCDYINVYMRAVVHDEAENPLTYDESFENADGKDQADVDGERDENVATMQDFLSQLTMRIYCGDQLIFEAQPGSAGQLEEFVFLGKLSRNETMELRVELDVPAELGNEYANRVGEVDWVFLVEAVDFKVLTVHKVWEDNNDPSRPEAVTVRLMRDGEVYEEVVLNEENQWTYTWDELDDRYDWNIEEVVPEGYEVTYNLEDNTMFVINKNDYEPEPEPDPINITVVKKWDDDDDKNETRPESVAVTLYNGDTAVEKVILSEENDWTYSWEGLDGHGSWSVLETGIPAGYTPTYRTSGEVVTITNTATLIQTGQLNWPIPVLGGMGLLMIFAGIIFARKRDRDA